MSGIFLVKLSTETLCCSKRNHQKPSLKIKKKKNRVGPNFRVGQVTQNQLFFLGLASREYIPIYMTIKNLHDKNLLHNVCNTQGCLVGCISSTNHRGIIVLSIVFSYTTM